MQKAKLLVSKNLPPSGDEGLRLGGTFQVNNLSPAITPLLNGFSFTIYGQSGTPLLTAFVPPGLRFDSTMAGWRSNSQGTRWTYKDSIGSQTPGLRSISVSHKVNTALGLFAFTLSGKTSNFLIDPSELPLRMDVALGGSAQAQAGQCGTITFNPEIDDPPECRLRQEGKTIKCN